MIKITSYRIWKILSLASLAVVLCLALGCNSQPSPSPSAYKNGDRLFDFDPAQVQELVLVKSDPIRGDHWMSTFSKTDSTHWRVSSPPNGSQLLDREANHTLLFHLLDSIRSLRVDSPAPNGPLEAFGLNPSIFAIKWKTAEKSYEVFVGGPVANGRMRYLSLNQKDVFVASGSAIRILAQIDSFDSLRKHNWSSRSQDEVDELTLNYKGKPFLYAQREGDIWTNRKHQAIKKDIDSLLDHVTSAQALKLVDDIELARKVKERFQSQPLYQAHLTNRRGQTSSLGLIEWNGSLYGVNSDRPEAVFLLQKQMARKFKAVQN